MGFKSCWALAAGLCSATSLQAQGVASLPGSGTPAVLARASAATVTLEVQGACCSASGSGLLLTPTGVIATSARLIAGARRVRVRLATGELFEALGALSYDPRLDLALILIPGVGLPSAPLANSDHLAVGQRLLAIGESPGQGLVVTDARLSAVRTDDNIRRLQLSVPVVPGSSGGPLVDEQGEVVGLVVTGAREGAELFNVAIPINDVRGTAGRLAGQTPTPFGATTYAGSPAMLVGWPLGDSPVGAVTGGTRTNPNLDLDFRPLNGVVLYFEEQYAGERRVRDSTAYSVSLRPGGTLGIERTNSRQWRDRGAAVAEQALRTAYDVGESDRSASVFTLRPFAGAIPTDAWELHIQAGRYRFSSPAGDREGVATPGTVPREMLSAILAALPDSLPPEVHVQVFDAVANQSQDVTVRFGKQVSRTVPVPLQGRECGAEVATRDVAVDVVQASRRTGADVVALVVLARRPHVILGGAAVGMTSSLKCVVIPGIVS